MNRKEATAFIDKLFNESRDRDGGPDKTWSDRSYFLSDLAEFLEYTLKEKDQVVSMDDVNLGAVIKKSEDDDGYVVSAPDADFTRCPVCESEDISYGDCDPDGIFIYRAHTCQRCGTVWDERYDLVQVTIEPGDTDIIDAINEALNNEKKN